MKILTKICAVMFAATLFSCSKEIKVGETMIIPEPQNIEVRQGQFVIDNSLTIALTDESLMPMAEFLQDLIAKSTGFKATIAEKGNIELSVDASKSSVDAYSLNVDAEKVEIVGGGYGGVLYGIESLRQLLPKEIEAENGAKDLALAVNAVSIDDAPHYAWRGFMMDVSRHFYNPSEVKRFLDMMAYYKLNKFHWHLTDDQGWRIEIKKYPLLTEKGAWREFNKHDRGCMERAAAQEMTDYEIDPAKLKINGTDTLYGGFYTQDEIKDIVAYAKNLNIDVIPEIDMPGHCLAAIENYKGVSCTDEIGWGKVFSSPICPGKDHALEFCKDIYSEIFELFPYEYVHLGADEVDMKNWKVCDDCQARIRKNNLKDEHELHAWFVKYMEKHFNENGRKLIGWDEIVEGGLSETSTVMWWRNWAPKTVQEAAEHGNDIVVSPSFNLYFDYQQNKNSFKSVYMFNPIPKGVTAEQAKQIKGAQANLWCEWIPSMQRAEFMTFPRMLSLSEVAWNAPEDRDFDKFLVKAVDNLQKLDVMKINYRPLDLTGFEAVNVFTEPGELTISCPQKDLKIYYTTDGTTPTVNSTLYTAPIKVEKTTDIKLRTFRPDGTAAEIVTTKVIVEDYQPAQQIVEFKGDGLVAKQYDYIGTKCSEITSAKFVKEYAVDSVSVPEKITGKHGLVIEGYFEVAEDTVLAIKQLSDDGSMLYIDDVLVIDNDGSHAAREIYSQKALAKGVHKIKVEYFKYDSGKPRLVFKIVDKNDENKVYPASDFKFKH